MDGITQLAKLLKERDNVLYLGPKIGKVLQKPPDIQIAIGDNIILTKEDLIISAHVLSAYQRDIKISGGIIDQSNPGTITLRNPPLPTTPSSETDYSIMNMSIPESVVHQMEYTDTLEVGDEVILIPSQDEQTYFLVDKAVRL